MNLSKDLERLDLILQTSPFEEKVTRNGLQKNIRVVIKNSPFTVQLKLKKHDIDLNNVAFEAILLYDNDTGNPIDEKEVDFVKSKPVEHKSTPNDIGDMVTVELRIKVLTSQHEDMFFRVKIEGFEPITKQPIKNLYALTSPIKVISKPEQLKKKQPPKKRSWNDILMDSVTKIQMQQSEQQRLIEKLLDHNFKQTLATQQILQAPGSSSTSSSSTSLTASGFPQLNGHTNGTTSSSSSSSSSLPIKMEFEDAFKQMMNAYVQLDPRQRAEKVRRVFRNASSRDSETLSELLDLFITEGVGGPLGTMAPLPMSPNQTSPVSPALMAQNQPTLITQQQNPFMTSTTTTTTTNTSNQTNGFVERNNANTDPYPFFSSLPTSFDNEFGSFNSGNDFIPF